MDPIRETHAMKPWEQTPDTQAAAAHSGFISRILGGKHLNARAFAYFRAPLLPGGIVTQPLPGALANSPSALANGAVRYVNPPVTTRSYRGALS